MKIIAKKIIFLLSILITPTTRSGFEHSFVEEQSDDIQERFAFFNPAPAIEQATPYMEHVNYALSQRVPQLSSPLRAIILRCLYPTPYEKIKEEKRKRNTNVHSLTKGLVVHYGLYNEQQFFPTNNLITSYFKRQKRFLIVHDKNKNDEEKITYYEKRDHIKDTEKRALLLIAERSEPPPPIQKDDNCCYCCALQ